MNRGPHKINELFERGYPKLVDGLASEAGMAAGSVWSLLESPARRLVKAALGNRVAHNQAEKYLCIQEAANFFKTLPQKANWQNVLHQAKEQFGFDPTFHRVDNIPQRGGRVAVMANHDRNILDGMALAAEVERVRGSTVKVITLDGGASTPELEPLMVRAGKEARSAWLDGTDDLVVFPSQKTTFTNIATGELVENCWSRASLRLAQINGFQIVPAGVDMPPMWQQNQILSRLGDSPKSRQISRVFALRGAVYPPEKSSITFGQPQNFGNIHEVQKAVRGLIKKA